MNSVAIVGAHGKIGQLIVQNLVAQGRRAVGIVRKTEQVPVLRGLGAEPVLLDVEQARPEQLATALEGVDAVVFSAGAGGGSTAERKRTVDYGGAVKLITAAKLAGVNRYVMVSAVGADDPLPPDTDAVWRAYVEAKRDADRELRGSGLQWTILRPGPLTDDPATGRVTLGEKVGRGEIPRADVAALVTAVLAEPATAGKQWEVRSGDTPLPAAILG